MADLVKVQLPEKAPLALMDLVSQVDAFAAGSRSPATRRAYRSDWRTFTAWCAANRLTPLPALPATLAVYLAHLTSLGRKAATIGRAVSSIAYAHHLANEPSPHATARVTETLRGIRRTIGVAQACKAPLMATALRRICAEIPDTVQGKRDRALLLLGWSGAFRRSELVALDVRDVAFTEEGLEVTIRRAKNDQEGVGRKIGVPFSASPSVCPVRAVRAWLDAAKVDGGPILRSVNKHGSVSATRLTCRSVALIVKRHVEAVGLDPAAYSGHSLRAGLATSAAKAGKSERSIMMTTGHKSTGMLRRYIRDASLFDDNASQGLL